MNSNNSESTNAESSNDDSEGTIENISNLKNMTSATTPDIPSFGWSGYAERVNGRFAMIGFTAILLIEALTHQTFLSWSGIFPG